MEDKLPTLVIITRPIKYKTEMRAAKSAGLYFFKDGNWSCIAVITTSTGPNFWRKKLTEKEKRF